TANKFLQNLENKGETGHRKILKDKLENRKQNDLESISRFVTEIEYLCSQLDKDMKEEDICVYIFKGIREPILHEISLHDNSNLK
ncbi:putative ATP-dependent RNA helicase ddx42, partial [Aphis craccivora]